LERDNDH
jgi:hypothetical protein